MSDINSIKTLITERPLKDVEIEYMIELYIGTKMFYVDYTPLLVKIGLSNNEEIQLKKPVTLFQFIHTIANMEFEYGHAEGVNDLRKEFKKLLQIEDE